MENPRKSEPNPVATARKGRISEVPTSASRHGNPLRRIRLSSKSLDPPSRRAETKAMSMSTVAHSINALVMDGAQREAKDAFHGKEKMKKTHVNIEMNEGGKTKGVNKQIMAMRGRSYCTSRIELADFLSCNGVRVVAADMPPFMQIHAVDCARKAHDSLEKFSSKTLALSMKKEFDGVYGPAWHCIVGTSFGSFVTHSIGGFLYFSMDRKLYVLLFKTTVQRVD